MPVVLVVLLRQRRRRDAFRFTAGVGALMLVGLLLAPSSFTSAAHATHGLISRASPWGLVIRAHLIPPGTVSTLGLVAAVLIIAEIARRSRHPSDLAVPVALALASYAIVAGFTLPWYALWSMPVAAMSSRRAVAVLTALHGAIVLAAYEVATATAAGRISGGLLTVGLPLLTVAIMLVLVVTATGDSTADSGQAGHPRRESPGQRPRKGIRQAARVKGHRQEVDISAGGSMNLLR